MGVLRSAALPLAEVAGSAAQLRAGAHDAVDAHHRHQASRTHQLGIRTNPPSYHGFYAGRVRNLVDGAGAKSHGRPDIRLEWLVKRPLVTVVVPTHGRPQSILACMQALALQQLRDTWEVVVVDDGSANLVAPRLLELYAGQLEVRVIRQDRLGPSAARNRGVQEARGEFVAFTDDDCLPECKWLGELASMAKNRPDALVGGTTTNGLPGELFPSTSQLIVDLVYEHFNVDPSNAYFFTSNNVICSRQRFLELGGFDEDFPRAGAEDRDFCDRWRFKGWPMVWQPSARIEHHHPQTIWRFLALCFRYGRGAYIYRAKRKARGSGTMKEDLEFHRTLARRVRSRVASHGSSSHGHAVYLALCAWQVANAAGFASQAARSAAARTLGRQAPGAT